jgi:signal transduction histidine kinase
MPEGASGFWSYAHDDNESEQNRIRRLAKDVEHEYELLTGGEKLELFLDDAKLKWGDDWQLKIQEALQATVFFIPIITPRYFRRPECRKELLAFAGQAESLGLNELLLPIYYVDVPGFDKDSPDKAVALVARRQREDWRQLRLEDPHTAEYRKGVNKLAKRLVGIAAETETRTTPPAAEAEAGGGEAEVVIEEEEPEPEPAEPPSPSSNEAGTLDQMAAVEVSFPKITDVMNEIGQDLTELNGFTEEAARELTESDQKDRGFRGRLAVANRLATRLAPLAERIQGRAAEYVSLLTEMDPGMLTMIRLASEDPESTEQAEEFFGSIRDLVSASQETMKQSGELAAILDDVAGFSRELRGPLHRIRDAIRDIVDAQYVIEGWGKRIDELEQSNGGKGTAAS